MRRLAHAKVNLNLSVSVERDAQGYHAVETVMCPLALADEVEVTLEDTPGVGLICEPDPIPSSEPDHLRANIAYRAAERMCAAFAPQQGVKVRIRKIIPSQAGLGGGSSDAAAVVSCLAQLWDIDPYDQRVWDVAASLGADVPFFLVGAPAHLTRRGDVLVERFDRFSAPVVLAKPAVGVSTAQAYRVFDELATPVTPVDGLVEALRRHDVAAVLGNLANNLQPAACQVAPMLNEVLGYLEGWPGLLSAPLLCGSGSCVAAFVRDDVEALDLADAARNKGWWAQATSTLG